MRGPVFPDLDFTCKFVWKERITVSGKYFQEPSKKACLVILSRTLDTRHGYKIMKLLYDREFKVQAMAPYFSFLVKRTPAETWIHELKGKKDPGEIPLPQNLTNLIDLQFSINMMVYT